MATHTTDGKFDKCTLNWTRRGLRRRRAESGARLEQGGSAVEDREHLASFRGGGRVKWWLAVRRRRRRPLENVVTRVLTDTNPGKFDVKRVFVDVRAFGHGRRWRKILACIIIGLYSVNGSSLFVRRSTTIDTLLMIRNRCLLALHCGRSHAVVSNVNTH